MAINHNRKYSTQCERAHREAIKVLAELSQANPRLQNVWFGLANSYAAVSDLQRRLRMEQDAEATARRRSKSISSTPQKSRKRQPASPT